MLDPGKGTSVASSPIFTESLDWIVRHDLGTRRVSRKVAPIAAIETTLEHFGELKEMRGRQMCKKNAQPERKELEKNVRRGTRPNPNSLNAQPEGSDNSMKGCLTLAEEDVVCPGTSINCYGRRVESLQGLVGRP